MTIYSWNNINNMELDWISMFRTNSLAYSEAVLENTFLNNWFFKKDPTCYRKRQHIVKWRYTCAHLKG